MQSVAFVMAAIQSLGAAQELTESDLVRYFWVCDESSRAHMLDDSDAAVCSEIFEELKARVFKGDSRALFEWWRKERDKTGNATPPAESSSEPR